MYPTANNFKRVTKINARNTGVSLTSERDRSIDLVHLPYHDQKEFFRLDRAYEDAFVQKHSQKVGVKKDPLNKALMANLKKDRIRVFRQFLNDDTHRKVSYTKSSAASNGAYSRVPSYRLRNTERAVSRGAVTKYDSSFLAKERDGLVQQSLK